MKKKNESERKCPCGRIITDPNNKTGLCPECQKKGNTIVVGFCAAALAVGVKKYGMKIAQGAVKAIQRIKK